MRDAVVARALRPGESVGIVTPSWPISMSPSPDPMLELERGMEVLRDLGLDPFLSDHALAEDGYMAGSPQERANDINALFADPGVAGIIASHGGHVAQSVLPHLDWEVIAANPKVFMGFSNMTTLNLAIHALTGLITFNGNMVIWHLGMDPTEYDLSEFRAVLMEGRTGAIAKNSEWRVVRRGPPGTGSLIGDAVALRGLAGTAYALPLDRDLVLFFEGIVDAPGIVDTQLRHLEQMGVFDRTRGVLIGSDGAGFTGAAPEVPFSTILLDVTSAYDFPILECDDFGHGVPNTVLPIGIRARLDAEGASLDLLDPPVAHAGERQT
ncbi:MAG: LD-carboxypeptidase [Acidimicrobiia bacterium]|nr:LD-carboxypeptidase [Acidimicrobiia bacterium]